MKKPLLKVSFLEIHRGTHILDLLNAKKRVMLCEDKDGSIAFLGLTPVPVTTLQEAEELISCGLQERTHGQTRSNAQSSRSHAILKIDLSHSHSICFIDLAGMERAADRHSILDLTLTSPKDRFSSLSPLRNSNSGTNNFLVIDGEGAEINKSLLALKECIRAMDLGYAHIPFRQSKLTMVQQYH